MESRTSTLHRARRPFLNERTSSAQFAEKFLLVHAVFKSFLAVHEDHWDLVVIKPPDFGVGVYVDFTPGEASTLVQLDEAFLDDFAEMTSLAGVNDNFPWLCHPKECSSLVAGFPRSGEPDKDGRRISE